MNFQGNTTNTNDLLQLQQQQQLQLSSGTTVRQGHGGAATHRALSSQMLSQSNQYARNVKLQNSSSSPTAIQRKNMYQAQIQMQLQQQQQLNLPAVNQSRSERSLENSNGYAGGINQTSRLNLGGVLTSRDHPANLQQLQLLHSQQMIPSNYTNSLGAQQQIPSRLSQNDKIKSYSRKLAKLVSNATIGGGNGSALNSRTPNSKKKVKTSVLGIGSNLTSSINNAHGLAQVIRSGLSTSRGVSNVSNMIQTTAIYGGNTTQAALASARTNLQIQTNQSKGAANSTFDFDEHIKNVIKNVERRNRVYVNNNTNKNPQSIAISSYLQQNATQLGNTQHISMIGGNNGSKTARNNAPSATGFNEYSPDAGTSQSKSPTNRAQMINPSQLLQQPTATTTQKNTIFSNFSNSKYQIGQKKNSQQSHSLGKKNSYQGIASSIMISSKTNTSGSQSRRRGSTKKDGMVIMMKGNLSNRQLEGEIFSATQKSIRIYDDAANNFKKKRESAPNMQFQNTYINAKRDGSKTQRVNTSSQFRHHNQSSGNLNQSSVKKQQNWFSPPSSSNIQHQVNNMSSSSNVFVNQNVLSSLDNNSSAIIDKTIRTSQFVSPRSFLNKSGGVNNQNQITSNALIGHPRISIGDQQLHQNKLLMSYDGVDENYNIINNATNLHRHSLPHQEQLQSHFLQQPSFMLTSFDQQKILQLQQLRFFRNFLACKVFKRWKQQSERTLFERKRLTLMENMLQSKSKSFGDHYRHIIYNLNKIKNLQFIDFHILNSGDVESEREKRKANKTNYFNEAITGIKQSIEKLQAYIVKSNSEYERRLKESTSSFGRKNSVQQQDGSNTQRQQQQKQIDKDNQKVMIQRCHNFDRFLNFTLVSLSSTLSYMLMNNKQFSGQKIKTLVKFHVYGPGASQASDKTNLALMYQTHSDYYLMMNPSFKSLNELVKIGIEESEQLIYNNRKLIETLTKLTQLFFNKQQAQNNTAALSPRKNEQTPFNKWNVNSFYQRLEHILKQSQSSILTKEQVLDLLSRDIEEAESIVRRMDDLKQILQFEERWQNLQSNSLGDANFIADLESNRVTWSLMERFNSLISQIPRGQLNLRYISLDFKPLYDQLSKIPRRVISHIERKVATALETDTIALRQDLQKAYEILQQNPNALNLYVEQVNTVKVMKETMGELTNRHESIKKLSILCKVDNRINVKDSVQSTILEVEKYIENLPILLRQSGERLDHSKPQMEQQMRQSCLSLTNKIRAFEKKYVEHYIEDASKLNETEQTLNELQYRQKMIDDIRKKVDLYQECISIMNMKESFQKYASEITCFEDFKELDKLHQYTFKLWTILDQWRSQRQNILQKPFLKLNFNEIVNFVEESTSFFEQKISEDQLFKQKLQGLSSIISSEMSDLQLAIYLLRDLKKDCLKKKHWNLIFNELGIQSLLQKDDFTLQDLQKYKIYSQSPAIRDIMILAEKEYDCLTQLTFIKGQIEECLAFNLVPYKDDIYIISEFDIVQQQVEEFQIQLKRIQKLPQITDVDLKEQITATLQSIQSMANVIEKMNDAQKAILTLDAIFSQAKIQSSLPNDYEKFLEIKKSFKINITGKIYQNPTVKSFQSLHLQLQDALEKISSKGTLIQKSLEDFIEAKRLAFPRFFFMTDKQFLEFIELADQNLDFNRFINILFPGVSKIFLDQPLQQDTSSLFKVPPPMINDLSQVKSEMIELTISNNFNNQFKEPKSSRGGLSYQKEFKQQQIKGNLIDWDHQNFTIENDQPNSNFNSKKSATNKQQQQPQLPKPKEVLGLISQYNELFLFEKKVPYQQNKVECWLQAAESSMQETVGKLISYAVNTFPKQSLDEWILDYPQQVILTTIHLILTHEINELFEEMRKEKDGEVNDGRDPNSDNGADSDEDYTGTNPKTPDTRDLIKNSHISHKTASQHISQKSSVRFLKKKDEFGQQMNAPQGTVPRKVSTYEFNSKSHHQNQTQSAYSSSNQYQNQQRIRSLQSHLRQQQQQYFSDDNGMLQASDFVGNPYMGAGHQEDDDFSESELEALDLSRERKKFTSNMFGSDFDLNLIADNEHDTMRILQEKSFRGLYLRLQFWINQICKSLYMSKSSSQLWKQSFEKDLTNLNQPEIPPLNFDLHPVQKLVMQTIINFLSYMRDVVYELKSKKIDNSEDFEWQKQMRLTWNGKDSGCKVDCGAWTTQQANEYFGANQRIPLTPLTNKYFVFISAAFREKSAVLFRCVPSHDYCGDVFQEFSNICSVPFKEYQCNPKLSMKSLMQFLNGAALASVWIFFEHVDKLDYLHLQTFNKEIQMVQQQFIIAELSQDSSVITAHITVGNQSISQCQRSIERIREQASLEGKRGVNDQPKGGISPIGTSTIGGGVDIKIEDNIVGNPNFEDDNCSISQFDEDEDDNSIGQQQQQNFNFGDKLIRQSNRRELQYQQKKNLNNNNNNLFQNLSQLDLEDDFQQNEQLEEDNQQEELKLDDQNVNYQTVNNHSKTNNKVCFGVFASISHTFNLKKEKWATEVSNALQSAFRVLSLTRPEMPVITAMLLKSEGFKDYCSLAQRVNDCFFRVQDMLQLNDRDDSFTIAVRDIKRLTKVCNSQLEKQIRHGCQEQQSEIAKRLLKKKNNMMVYPMEKKSKQMILREIEEEDQREAMAQQVRKDIEEKVTSQAVYLFLYEKLYSYYQNLKYSEERLRKDLKEIIAKVFGKDSLKDIDNSFTSTQDQQQKQQLEKQILSVGQTRGLSLSFEQIKKLSTIHNCLKRAKPLALIGKAFTGKTEFLTLVSKHLLHLKPVYFNPSSLGSYRELYGIYDPFSTAQQVIEQQLGQVTYSLFTVMKNEVEKQDNGVQSMLVFDGELDSVFNETIIPYLEYQAFGELNGNTVEVDPLQQSLQLSLPNGIKTSLRKNVPIAFEMRGLENSSPRFISSVQIINMKESIELIEFSGKMKQQILKIALAQFPNNHQSIKEGIDYCVDQIILPSLNQLKKAKQLEKSGIDLIQALQWTLTTFQCFLKEVKSLQGNVEQSLIKLSLMTIIQGVGYALTADSKVALEELFSGLKSKLGLRGGSLFNYIVDFDTLEIKELKPYGIENDIIVNNKLLSASHFAKLLIKNRKNLNIVGQQGTQKSTIVRYLLKNYQSEIVGKVIKIPVSCFISHKSLRNILQSKTSNINQQAQTKPTLVVIEDVNIALESMHINILEYLRQIKLNKFRIFTTESIEAVNVPSRFVQLTTQTKANSQQKASYNQFLTDLSTTEHEDLFKVVLSRKLQVQTQFQQQLQNVIFSAFQWLEQQDQVVNSSSVIELSNMHNLISLINRLNTSSFKDQNLLDCFFYEFNRVICDRIIYPDTRLTVQENLLKFVKKEITLSTLPAQAEYIDDLILYQNRQKLQASQSEIQEIFGDYQKPLLKVLVDFSSNLKKNNFHQVYISMPGTLIVEGLQNVASKLKYQTAVPEASKYRDSFTFIQQVNQLLVQSIKSQKKLIIIIQDSYLNDLSYIDYIVNLLVSLRESSQNFSVSIFNSLDAITAIGLRLSLIEAARELHNQQISHSPHSGISSPASPSSLTATIADTQLLMNALSKISHNVHFVLSIQNLQNYQNYVTSFPQIEYLFQVAFIPNEKSPQEQENQILSDIQKWAHEFILKQSFDESYQSLMKKIEHPYNNQVNQFFIPEGKENAILSNALFDNINHLSINQELNLSIPPEFTLSQQRFELFKQVYQNIKQILYNALASHKQFYQQYFAQYQQLQSDFMKKILTKDNAQTTKSHLSAFNLLSIQEKIDMYQSQLKTKEQAIKLKEREQSDLLNQLEKLQEESSSQRNQGESKVEQILSKVKNAPSQDFKALGQGLIQGGLSDNDMEVLSALQGVLQTKKSINVYLTTAPQDLITRLQQVIQQGLPEQIITKYVKNLQRKIQYNEIEKPLCIHFFEIINELSKKSGSEKKLQQYDNKIYQLKEINSFNSTLIQLYNNQMKEIREEVEDLLIKEKNMKNEMRDILRKIDMKEIKNLRNEYKLKSLIKQGKKSESKLDKVKIRIKNLEGDCLILACSIVYLGVLSLSERMEFRKQMSEKLLQTRNIESSEYWQNTQSEQIHCKYFKKIIQNDLGLKSKMFIQINHLFVDSLFSEFLFTFIFNPTIPVIYDSVGNYQQYLTEEILDEFKNYRVKVLFGSDYMIQTKISTGLALTQGKQNLFQKSQQLLFINDLNDYSKIISGKCQDQAILHMLADPLKSNRRIQEILSENTQLSIPQITLFSANQHFNLNHDYIARATIYNATYVNKNEAWIEIKQILLKHFLPDNYQKIVMIKQQTLSLKEKIVDRQKAFDQLFLKVRSQSVEDKDHKNLEEIRNCYLDVKQLDEDYQQYNQAFHNLINEHPLLASYSNIFVILYFALKELSRFTEEITYSWKIYTKVIDMIIAKIIRDLTMNLKNKENEESDGEEDQEDMMNLDGKKKKKKDKEFTIDEEFFHSVIMPSIYSTIVAGIKQEHVSLFNLIFSLEIALKKTTVNQEERDFFVQKFFKIKNCYDWRLNPHKPSTIPTGFANYSQRIKQQEYMNLKRDILKIYPDMRKLFETIEIKIGKEFTFKEANTLLYQKLFKLNGNSDSQWKDLQLIKKINIGFICPDDEWRSKICQFVYEELTTIFDFTEDLNKLHNFIKTASWSIPVALFTSNSINIVNTVCSIASYYGVGLEVLRTDYQQSIKKHERYYQNKEVNDNLKSADYICDPEKPLSQEAACIHYDQIDPSKEDRILMQKQNYQRMFSKDELEIDDKQITQNQSSIQLIEKCAENGTWVLISTLKFPSFWYKISRKLEKMAKKGKVLNTFRLFFDLQGYSLQEIPESFLFNHSVKFYLTEKNNEDMEGFNDVWANILNDDLLNAKDMINVPILEPPSDIHKINLNLESNLYESSMENLIPQTQSSNARDMMNPSQKKTVKDDKITYSMSQHYSRDTIVLPQIFTKEHLKDIMSGGDDLKSPRLNNFNSKNGPKVMGRLGAKLGSNSNQRNIEDDISEISLGNQLVSSGMISNTRSLLMDSMSRMEGVFFSELNHAFARKMTSNQKNDQQEQQQQQQPKYEMVKKPTPNHKRQQPPQKV